jgi:hypothetical protein
MIVDGWFKLARGDDVVLGNFPAGVYPPPYPTHGHGDITSFSWLHAGHDILTDPGRYRYTPDETSLFQKSAVGHNVPLVNGMSPVAETVVANGAWWPLPYSGARLELAVRAGGIDLTHDGFARATPVTRHRRRIVPYPGLLEVVDDFDGVGRVEVALCWHFGAEFDRFDIDEFVAVGRRVHVRVSCEAPGARLAVVPEARASLGGWTSRAYGERRPSLSICLKLGVELPTTVTTRFAFHGS